MHLLHQGRIAGETARIQIAHLIDQHLQLVPRLRAILHRGANLVEKVQSLLNLPLRIGRVGTLLGRYGLTGDAGIAGVVTAVPVALAVAPATGNAIADLTTLASAGLTACLTGLSRLLTAATGLALSGLTLLSTLLTRLASAQAGDLVAQTGQIVHGAAQFGVLGGMLSAAQSAGRFADLPAQF